MGRYDDDEEQVRLRKDYVIDARAPMADPSKNIGAPASNSVWANIFKQNTGIDTQRFALRDRLAAGAPDPGKNLSQQVLDEILPRTSTPAYNSALPLNPFNESFSSALRLDAPQPLSVLAGGINHQQAWSSTARPQTTLRPFAVGERGILNVQNTAAGQTRGLQSPYGQGQTVFRPDEEQRKRLSWASSFSPNG